MSFLSPLLADVDAILGCLQEFTPSVKCKMQIPSQVSSAAPFPVSSFAAGSRVSPLPCALVRAEA